ncbi:MAG: AraC family transcriptional regulator [Bacteroidales bacterium]|nr:AraC family transcriptional regulator [Bacteroidales bacterium]
MKAKIRLHKILRLSALVLLLSLAAADWFKSGTLSPLRLCLNLWCSLFILMCYPLPDEQIAPSLMCGGVSFAMMLALKLTDAPVCAFVFSAGLLLFCLAVYRVRHRYYDIPPLYLVAAVWPGVQAQLHLLHLCAFMLAGIWLCALSPENEAASWTLSAFVLAFNVVQLYRIRTRSTLFLGKKKEGILKQTQKNQGYTMPVQYVDSESRSAVLFNDVVRIMETRKPYLQDNFVMEDLSRMTHTNRMYLSRAINFHSGRNFNQLVNYYRVKYAVELLKKDAGLKMVEVAQMSGFHNTVSFNMAFKLNEHITPSEFVRSLKKLT